MFLELTQPQYLFGLVLIAVLVGAHRCTLVDFSRRQRVLLLAVRISILTLIVLALAGLTLVLPTHQTKIVILADHSRSIDSNAAEKRNQFIESCRTIIPPDRFGGVLPFGTENETNIADALNPALAMIPPNYVPHLVLVSDGNETTGNVLSAIPQFNAVISTVPLPNSADPEVQIADLKLPGAVRQGEPFYIDIIIQSNVNTEGTITLYKGAFKLLEEKKPMKIGENTFRFRQTIDNQRQQEFTVTINAAKDTILDNNRLSGLVFAGGKPRVLIVDSEPRTIRDLASALREQDITAEVRPPEGIPKTLDDLENFEAVLFSNVPATAMTVSQMNLLRTYVSDLGGGFMMLGGEQSFGLGGYYKTPIEEILPVRCDFKKEQEKPSLAICLVIDRSGSMGGQKMELAKDAAKAAIELLSPKDFAAVIAFDNESYVVCPMQSTASTSAMMSAISTIEAAGGTNIYPALADAYEQLRRTPARLKHVILLTDGYSAPGDFDGIVRQFIHDQMTVSTVGVGEADNELLKTISETGRGRYYSCDDPQAIPQIFAKETMTASKSAIRETPFAPVLITATPVLRQIDFESAPPLLGYVVTKAKPTGQFILATESGDPLLVWWRFGLGHSVTFSSDAKSKWGAEWLGWEGYGKFWAQTVRYVMRSPEHRGSALAIEQHSGGAHLTLDAVDDTDHYVNGAEGKTVLIRDLSKQEIVLPQTAPGRYEAEIPLESNVAGTYHLQTSLSVGGRVLTNQSRGIKTGYSDELRIRATNDTLLRELAELTGGGFNLTAEELLELQPLKAAGRTIPLAVWLLTAAALLFVFDVLLRRIEIF